LEASIFEIGFQPNKVALTHSTNIQPPPNSSDLAFERLFKEHFKSLFSYAFTILKDEAQAEEIVQQVFFKIWDKKLTDNIQVSMKAYLYKAVYHESLNYLKHRQIRNRYQQHVMHQHQNQHDNATRLLAMKEMEEKLREALNSLPQQCRTIFQMSRFDGLKYQEIAQQLGLSIKTVENQMGKALKQLRIKLIDFLPILILLFFYH